MEDFGNLLFFHENGDVSVNKIFYLLIIFFFGAIGIHKFLVRHYLSGFLYLIFSWTFIPLIISVVEFFITIFKKEDNYGRILIER
jgi:TM2 domain-containing membrane protein YozV